MDCPKCGSTDQLAMADGTMLCLDCRHEHDGKETAPRPAVHDTPTMFPGAPGTSVEAIMHARTAAEVLSVDDDHVDAPSATATLPPTDTPPNLAGRFVRIRNIANVMLCTDDDGGDVIRCVDTAGTPAHFPRADVVHVDDDGTDPLAPVVGATTVTDDQPFDPAIFAVASLAITQGLACVGDDGVTLYNPRIGWLPPPCNEVPEAEQGVAYAIAVLITTFGLDRSNVEQIAATLMQGAAAPESETTE